MIIRLYVVGGDERIALPEGKIRCLAVATARESEPLASLLPTLERFEVCIDRAEAPAAWLEFVAHHRGELVALRCKVGETFRPDGQLEAVLDDAWRMVFE